MSSLQQYLESGREKLARGDFAGALRQADMALGLGVSSFEALQLRSRALYLLGRDAEALQTLRQARTLLRAVLPDTPRSDAFASDEPTTVSLPNQKVAGTDALETLLALRERYQLDAELLALLAELAEDAGRFEIAREAFEELVEIEPNRLEAWEGLAHVLSHEDLDAAFAATERALQVFPAHAPFYELLGFMRYRRGQYQPALLAYRQAIECGADHADTLQALIQCYLAMGKTDAGLELLGLLVQREAQNVEVHRFAIEAYLQCHHPEQAMAPAHQLVRLQPSHAETYCYKAWVELALGSMEAAECTLCLGFRKAIDGAFALFELVELLIGTGKLQDALKVADLAYTLAPDHPESSAARGKVLRETGALCEALAAFRQASTLAPQDDAYQTWIGVVLDNLGDYQEALRQFNHVLSRHPTDVWTLCNRGLSYLALQMLDRALADFNRAVEIDPHDAPLYFWRACALTKLGDRDAAFRDLRRAVDLSDEIEEWLAEEPALTPLRHDPRYRTLFHHVGSKGQ